MTIKWHGPEMLATNLLEAKLFTYVNGNPGASKSVILLAISARLTRGMMPGDFVSKPLHVLYVSTEGTFLRSHGPRFEVNGGNEKYFHFVNETLHLPSKIDRLKDLIKLYKAKVVIIDPINYHLDPQVHTWTKTSIELGKIANLCETENCTIIAVDWPAKSRKKGDLSSAGNRAFTGVLRQQLAVGRLNVDEWVIGVSKANDLATEVGWIYSLELVSLGLGANNKPVSAMRVNWVREAKPFEVRSAFEQAKLEDDPNMRKLLAFMNPPAGVEAVAFETDDILKYLVNAEGMGQKKARALLNSCETSGYLTSVGQGKGGDYHKSWTITPSGTMRLAADEESVESAMTTLFPAMDWPAAPPAQLALPNGAKPTTRRRPKKGA